MNLLAHAVLAPAPGEVRVGNIIADFVRPLQLGRLPAAVQVGVRQHRKVDAFTDSHPVVARSIRRISPEWGWFSGILVDVFYDYLLCQCWNTHGAREPLRSFADRLYAELEPCATFAAPEHSGFIPAVIADDRFVRYATLDGIANTLEHLSRRIAQRMPDHARDLTGAMSLLVTCEQELRSDFEEFFPQVRAYACALPEW